MPTKKTPLLIKEWKMLALNIKLHTFHLYLFVTNTEIANQPTRFVKVYKNIIFEH